MPVLINTFGTEERTAWALGVERLDELGREGQGPPPAQDAGLAPREAPEGLRAPRRRPRGAEGRQERAVPGGGRDRQPVDRRPAGPLVLAEGRGVLHHLPAGDHARPGDRAPERRHLPDPGLRRADARPPLADPQGRGRARARGAPHRQGAHPGGDRPRRRPGDDVRGHGAAPAGARRDAAGRVAPREGRRDGEVPDDRPRGAGPRGDRAGGLLRPGGVARRGAVRRPHGLLLARPPLPRLPPDGGDAPPRRDLPDDRRGAAAHGGLLARQGDGAPVPADHPDDAAGDRRHEHAGRGHLPQPGDRVGEEALPRPGPQGDVRALGARAPHAGEERRRGRRVGERPRPLGGRLARHEQHRPGARPGGRGGADRTTSTTPRSATATAGSSGSTPPRSGRRSTASSSRGRRRSACPTRCGSASPSAGASTASGDGASTGSGPPAPQAGRPGR